MMKLTNLVTRFAILAIAVSVLGISASAQEKKITEKEVPPAVIAAFKSAYPNATIKGYARERENGQTFYEIESKDGNIGRDVLYHEDGSVAEIEETMAAGDLPSAAQELIRTRYPGATIAKAEKSTERAAQGDKVGYEVVVTQGKKRFTLEFDAEGKLKGKGK